MTDGRRTAVAELVLSRLAEVLERLARIELHLSQQADDLDALDRGLRPFGDGTKLPRRSCRDR